MHPSEANRRSNAVLSLLLVSNTVDKMSTHWKTKCFGLINKMFWRYKQNVLAFKTKCFSVQNKMFCYWKTKCFVVGKQNVLLLENKMLAL